MTQPLLNLFHQRDTQKAEALEAAVYRQLEDGQWHLRRALCERIPGLNERAIRLIASESRGQIVGSDRGYRLTRFASVEEIDHAERQLISQAEKMRARAIQIRKCRNSGGRAVA